MRIPQPHRPTHLIRHEAHGCRVVFDNVWF